MRKNYRVFEEIFDDKDPFVYRGLACVGYQYKRASNTYEVWGYDYNRNKNGNFYLGCYLDTISVKAEDLIKIKKNLKSIYVGDDGVVAYFS